ncbi:putative acylesterase/phospholipase RssA [Oxalobacteraceae bacterium GrIS 2.11]
MSSGSAIILRAGPLALDHIRQHGLQAMDIAAIPAAAGGPKGLALQALDQWLFGEWLSDAPRKRTLIGSSIGAWRMAAASMPNPAQGFARLGKLYCQQSYPPNPGSTYVTEVIEELLNHFIDGQEQEIVTQPVNRLHILASKGRGLLKAPQHSFSTKAGFIAATLSNIGARSQLARHMERVVISDLRDELSWLRTSFDAFPTEFAALTGSNLKAALLASGTLPLIMDPVRHIPGAPQGTYWDGGLIDYHLALPYSRLTSIQPNDLVLYPHFTDHIIPGWLDKAFAWRRASKGKNRHWLDNVLLIAPSEEFVRSLPRQKLPDRKDFTFHGSNHQLRIQEWQHAIGASEKLRDAFADFVNKPAMQSVQAF